MKHHTTDQLLILGMALTTDKKAMERRVRGVFARKTSAKGAAVLSLLLVFALGFASFTTACQPVQRSGRQKEVAFSASSPLYRMLDAPNRFTWKQDSFDGMFHFTANVDLNLPDVSAVPVARAGMREFTQADLENVSRVIFGADAVYTCIEEQTKEFITDYLVRLRETFESLEADPKAQIRELALYQTMISYYERVLPDAPAAAEQRVVPLKMKETLSPTADAATGFSGAITKDGYQFRLTAENDAASREAFFGARSYVYASMGRGGYSPFSGTVKEAPEGVAIMQAQAEEQAKAIASQLTDELQFCYSAPVHGNRANDRKEGWACVFMRAIDGFPTAFVSAEVNGNIMYDVPYAQEYETMTIVIDDHGMADFQWVNPMTVTRVEQRKTGLLPFLEIVARVPYEIRMKYLKDTVDTDTERDITITAVSFGLMRVGASGAGSFSFEPVWNFFYEFDDVSKKIRDVMGRNDLYAGYPNMTSALTLSAIDGRLIDRNTGY